MGNIRQMSADDVSSDEWFARYARDAVILVALMLTAIGVALYLHEGEYLRDWSKEPGAGFLACMVLCPVLGIVTLGVVIYAGIRLFLRPRTFGHAFVRLTFLVAHVLVFLICIDTLSFTATALIGSASQLSSGTDATQAWSAIEGRHFSASQYDVPEGVPEGLSSPLPFGVGAPGPAAPGRGTSSR